jgi:hypothetical protein
VGDSLRWPRDTLYPLKLALTSPTGGVRSVGIFRACRLKPRSLFVECVSTLEKLLNTWTDLYETWYVYHSTWLRLVAVVRKFLSSIRPTLQPLKLWSQNFNIAWTPVPVFKKICVCTMSSEIIIPIVLEYMNRLLWNLVCVLYDLKPPKRHTSRISPIQQHCKGKKVKLPCA